MRMSAAVRIATACIAFSCVLAFTRDALRAQTLSFTDVTLDAGITHTHGFVDTLLSTRRMYLAGVAAGDYDRDGWTDLYVIRGSLGPNLLYRNLGDGTFEDVAAGAGVAVNGDMASGPLFFHANGDSLIDLFVAGTRGTPNRMFMANGDDTFTDHIAESGLPDLIETYSASAADFDRDGDLDLFLTHWEVPMQESHLWRNNGHGVFTCVDNAAGIRDIGDGQYDYSFTANFCDLNNDRWPDIVVAGDFETSRVFLNRGDGTFVDATAPVITDENGMGSTVGDYDNDGDLDWFVSSVFDETGVPNDEWGITGNRMYRNRGNGVFDDATDAAGVREGGWGWGASFADFDNDGWLDLYHVNGWPFEVDTFLEDPARLFMNDHNGGFIERSSEAGVASTAQGRGVVCFDYDRDGDIDIFITNYNGAPSLLRNDAGNVRTWLTLILRGGASNPQAIGARVRIQAGGLVQVREVSCGNNYLSQNPAEIQVGTGTYELMDYIHVDWPNGTETTLRDVTTAQSIVLEQPRRETPQYTGGIRIVSAGPNPFVTEMTLAIEGAGNAAVTAVIYDVAGRRVRALAPSGTNTFDWDGRDARSVSVPAGVYWISVSDGASSDVRRVVLVR